MSAISVADPLSSLLAARADAPLGGLHTYYDAAEAASLLVDPGVLAVFEFAAPAKPSDPRHVVVDLRQLSDPPLREVWRVTGTVSQGHSGLVNWSSDGDWCLVALSVDEADHGGILDATRVVYLALGDFLRAHPDLHVLRLWNYFDAITDGAGDSERYRQFCVGRDDGGLADMFADGYPAATAIGTQQGRRQLQVYGLASRRAGSAVENPRQLSAWRYPREYGPVAPGFARAMRAGDGSLLISGTAAIVGHRSQFDDDLPGQTDEMLANLRSLFEAAGVPAAAARGQGLSLKVYLRGADDVAYITTRLREALPELSGLLALGGVVCRRELVVEVDGVLA